MIGGDGFCGIIKGRQVIARRVLVATGLKDKSPTMPNLRKAVAQAVLRYCPICDGFEATDRNIGVFGQVKGCRYERLINFCRDVGTKDALQFLMTREITHMRAFSLALETMGKPPFSIGKIAPTPKLVDQFFNDSTGQDTMAKSTRADHGMKASPGNS